MDFLAWLSWHLAAATDPVDLGFKALNLGLAGVFLYLLITGVLRRAGEVEEANKRVEAAEARADREAAARQKLQDAMATDLSPALLNVRLATERMVEAAAQNAELMQKVIAAFLDRIGRV